MGLTHIVRVRTIFATNLHPPVRHVNTETVTRSVFDRDAVVVHLPCGTPRRGCTRAFSTVPSWLWNRAAAINPEPEASLFETHVPNDEIMPIPSQLAKGVNG